MIISASRRTDIPAFHSQWFMDRIREGYCYVANPFNKNNVTKISLKPEDIDVIVFWTKNAEPILGYIDELFQRGYKFYFQYTLNGYSKVWEPGVPDFSKSIETFIALSDKIGKERVIWRYDPIIFSNITDFEYHYNRFTEIANLLKDRVERVVISIVDDYRGAMVRIKRLEKLGVKLMDDFLQKREFGELIIQMSRCAFENGMEIYSCAEEIDLSSWGVLPGKCIDDEYIGRVFGIEINNKKDRNQRKECGCVVSKDIGMYNSCLHQCIYCYANNR